MSDDSRPAYVLDSFAVLAHLQDEPCSDQMEGLLKHAEGGQAQLWMCVINIGEVMYITERNKGERAAQDAIGAIDQLPIIIADVDRDLALAAARLKARYPIAYADAFAAALAQREGAAVVTGDPEFRALAGEVQVEWLTPSLGQ